MKGGFNKILRNIVAGSADTEYEKVSHIVPEWFSKLFKLTLTLTWHITETDEGNFPHGLQGTQGKARHM